MKTAKWWKHNKYLFCIWLDAGKVIMSESMFGGNKRFNIKKTILNPSLVTLYDNKEVFLYLNRPKILIPNEWLQLWYLRVKDKSLVDDNTMEKLEQFYD